MAFIVQLYPYRGSYTGIFVLRDYLFLFSVNLEFNNYSSCSLTKRLSVPREKLELIIDIRDYISYLP